MTFQYDVYLHGLRHLDSLGELFETIVETHSGESFKLQRMRCEDGAHGDSLEPCPVGSQDIETVGIYHRRHLRTAQLRDECRCRHLVGADARTDAHGVETVVGNGFGEQVVVGIAADDGTTSTMLIEKKAA